MGLFRKTKREVQVEEIQPTVEEFQVEKAFRLAYGRDPLPKDLDWLSGAGVARAACASDLELLRKVIAVCDRQTYPTPVTVRFSGADLVIADMGSFKLVLDKDDISVSRPILGTKDYEFHLRRLVEQVLKPGMTAMNVGANVGFYTMLFASIVGPAGRVLAFEPNSENDRLILLSKRENGFDQVQLFPLALSDITGAAYFSPMIGSNGGLMPNTPETLKHPNCVVVACQPLDDIFQNHVDFIKVDIEGAEYRALLGAKKILQRYRPVVTTEFSMEMMPRVSGIAGGDFLRWMGSLGYTAHLIPRDGTTLQAVGDVDAFLANWGDPVRIEDLVFLPVT